MDKKRIERNKLITKSTILEVEQREQPVYIANVITCLERLWALVSQQNRKSLKRDYVSWHGLIYTFFTFLIISQICLEKDTKSDHNRTVQGKQTAI